MSAQRLGISDHQCRRLLARYREHGPLGMTSRRRGKASNNQLPQGLAAYALNIIRERYNDLGPTLACEKIQQPHYRRACAGELIQIDGCDHRWFENLAPACTRYAGSAEDLTDSLK